MVKPKSPGPKSPGPKSPGPKSPGPKSPVRAPERRHNAGILDIRNIIGALLGIYGLILLAMAVFTDDRGTLTEDVNANLWAGLALVAAAVVFVAWARVRPVKVPEVPESEKG